MTIEERITIFCERVRRDVKISPWLELEMVKEMRAAVEEEREACAQIVEENRFKEPGEVADMIRARSTEAKR